MVCRALEESFLEGDGATANEREALEWVRRYREAKKIYYSRQERKERWDEGRIGGWTWYLENFAVLTKAHVTVPHTEYFTLASFALDDFESASVQIKATFDHLHHFWK
jgi:hypothetical protein